MTADCIPCFAPLILNEQKQEMDRGPAMYALTPSMLTGVTQLDAEHQDLVTVINRIASAEERHDSSEVLTHLRHFRDELAGHFRHEEEYLGLLSYPARDAHAKHHAETISALERIADELADSVIDLGGIAAECFYELLGTVLTMDMRFLDWHQEKKRAAG